MSYLYGNHVLKSGLGRITDNTPAYAGVVVCSMSDVPLGFATTAKSTLDCRKLDPSGIVAFHQARAEEASAQTAAHSVAAGGHWGVPALRGGHDWRHHRLAGCSLRKAGWTPNAWSLAHRSLASPKPASPLAPAGTLSLQLLRQGGSRPCYWLQLILLCSLEPGSLRLQVAALLALADSRRQALVRHGPLGVLHVRAALQESERKERWEPELRCTCTSCARPKEPTTTRATKGRPARTRRWVAARALILASLAQLDLPGARRMWQRVHQATCCGLAARLTCPGRTIWTLHFEACLEACSQEPASSSGPS